VNGTNDSTDVRLRASETASKLIKLIARRRILICRGDVESNSYGGSRPTPNVYSYKGCYITTLMTIYKAHLEELTIMKPRGDCIQRIINYIS